ncbi:basic proline-rich protein-like [Physeter macrocephalus]|uniref:Basic proline-rich protein-like n=1 Tax=Physeter macrocephalus TaxID=9755 RepID=A0A2Y9TIG1_PHYMC|nr:basic proline-rich protein-like [Physeter catodon]|eukprot:XP_023989402.1 basic proline-rich protein-like [Physeter catodon]
MRLRPPARVRPPSLRTRANLLEAPRRPGPRPRTGVVSETGVQHRPRPAAGETRGPGSPATPSPPPTGRRGEQPGSDAPSARPFRAAHRRLQVSQRPPRPGCRRPLTVVSRRGGSCGGPLECGRASSPQPHPTLRLRVPAEPPALPLSRAPVGRGPPPRASLAARPPPAPARLSTTGRPPAKYLRLGRPLGGLQSPRERKPQGFESSGQLDPLLWWCMLGLRS